MKKAWIILLCAFFLTGCAYSPVRKMIESAQTSEDTQTSEATTQVVAEHDTSVEEVTTEVVTEATTEAVAESTTDEWIRQYHIVKTRDYYSGILENVNWFGYLPDGKTMEFFYSEDEPNQYAIFDVDCDGKEELLLSLTDTYTAGMLGRIYGYDAASNTLIDELSEFPSFTCYGNGTVTVGWSHNQGLSGDFWPYNLYSYDATTDTYVYQGKVDAWNKNSNPTDYYGNAFPDKKDKNGDGMIFYFSDASGEGFDTARDNKKYNKWLKSYIGDSTAVEIPWQEIAYENYGNCYAENVRMFLQQYKEKQLDNGTDLALAFMESGGEGNPAVSVETVLQNKFNVSMDYLGSDDIGFAYEVKGYYNGEELYDSYREGPASFIYKDKQIGDATIFGVYPGMSEIDATTKLLEAGLYQYETGYTTGISTGNYTVHIEVVDGIVSYITMYVNASY